MGRTSAQRKLPVLLKRSGGRCEQCGRRVVMFRTVQSRREVIGKVTYAVHWKTPWGKVATYPVATVEHVRRVADGGRHHIDNLRVLCGLCNRDNNRDALPKRNGTCRCGRKKTPMRKKCDICQMGFYAIPILLRIGDTQEIRDRMRKVRSTDAD